jgi:hypothetical protein
MSPVAYTNTERPSRIYAIGALRQHLSVVKLVSYLLAETPVTCADPSQFWFGLILDCRSCL